jgi:hypothetical protein
MSLLGRNWKQQRRNVDRLGRFVRRKRIEETGLRSTLKRRSLEAFARLDTMLMIGATGAIWTSRLKDADGENDRRPLIQLFLSTLVVRRWRRLADRVIVK